MKKRILLDHCVPKPLRRWLPDDEVQTCFEQGWARLRDGELLPAAEAAGFDVLITADRNLRFQQNLSRLRLAVVILPTNRLQLLPFLVPSLLAALAAATPGSCQELPLP